MGSENIGIRKITPLEGFTFGRAHSGLAGAPFRLLPTARKLRMVELSSQFFVVLSAPFFFAAQLRCMLGKCSPRAHTRWPSIKPSRLAPETNSSRLVGRNQRAAPSFLVTVIYGHNGEDQPPKISRRRTTRFDDRAESEKIFKRECDIAQRDFPGRVDATDKIYASLRAA